MAHLRHYVARCVGVDRCGRASLISGALSGFDNVVGAVFDERLPLVREDAGGDGIAAPDLKMTPIIGDELVTEVIYNLVVGPYLIARG